MPRVTVLLPVRDQAACLPRAMQSILRQRWHDLQLLVLDDGSEDGSGRLAAETADARVRVHRSEQPVGLAAILNQGLALSDSEYVARMDADDWSHPERLAKQLAYLGERRDIAACGTAVTAIQPDGSRRLWRYPAAHDAIRASLLFENVLAHPSSMLRRATLETLDIRYDPSFEKSQDYDLWERLGRRARLGNLPGAYVEYRVSPPGDGGGVARQQRFADRVRLRQLQALGLDVGESELRLHSAISRWETAGFDLDAIEAWLQRLLQANVASGIYRQDLLEGVVRERLFRAARHAVLRDLGALQRYRRSSLRGQGLRWRLRELAAALRAWRQRAASARGGRHGRA